MRIRRILSVSLFVDAIPDVRDFYLEHLALPFAFDRERVLALYPGETALNLAVPEPDAAHLVGRTTGVALRCRGDGDLRRLIMRLRERQVPLDDADFGPFRGGHRLLLTDPAGNRLAVWEDMEHRSDLNFVQGPSCVAVRVRSLRAALDFYVALLEVPMLDQPAPSTAVLFPDATNLVLTTDDAWAPCPPVSGETGLALLVDDMPSLAGMLAHRGVRFVEEPKTMNGVMVAAVRDPDGNAITFMGRVT